MTEQTHSPWKQGQPKHWVKTCPKARAVAGGSFKQPESRPTSRNGQEWWQGHLGCRGAVWACPPPQPRRPRRPASSCSGGRRPKGAGWAVASPLSNLGSLSVRPRHTPQHDTPAVTGERDWAFSTFFPLPRITRPHHNPLHVLGSRPKKENSARFSGCFFSRP